MSLRIYEIKAIANTLSSEAKKYNNDLFNNLELDTFGAEMQLNSDPNWKKLIIAKANVQALENKLSTKNLLLNGSPYYHPVKPQDIEIYRAKQINNLADYNKMIALADKYIESSYNKLLNLITITPMETPAGGLVIMRRLLGLPTPK